MTLSPSRTGAVKPMVSAGLPVTTSTSGSLARSSTYVPVSLVLASDAKRCWVVKRPAAAALNHGASLKFIAYSLLVSIWLPAASRLLVATTRPSVSTMTVSV